MQNEKSVKKRLLTLLNNEELQFTQKVLRKEDIQNVSRGFLISKLQEVNNQEIFQNGETSNLFLNKIDELLAFFERLLNQIESKDLIIIYGEVTSQKLKGLDLNRSDIIKRLLADVPINNILSSKHFQERLKPKYVSTSDIKSLNNQIDLVRDEAIRASNNVALLTDRIKIIQGCLTEVNAKLEPMHNIFTTPATPSTEDILKALYEEAIVLGDKPTPESFHNIVERLQKKLCLDERTFLLKGIELLLTHYLISQVKGLSWQPTLQDFVNILKEEMKKLNPSGDRVDIPTLRTALSKRLGIAEELFDDLLISSWKADKVKLEAGAPIGEFNVKFLVTKEDQKFYYVRQR